MRMLRNKRLRIIHYILKIPQSLIILPHKKRWIINSCRFIKKRINTKFHFAFSASPKELIKSQTDQSYAQEKAITKYQEVKKAQEELAAGIVDLNNEYQLKLNPNMAITEKQFAELTKAVQEYDKAVKSLEDVLSVHQ